MEPPPPPITIVDPNAPAGTADLLDSGRDQWRPSGRQKLVIALTALAVALMSGLVAEVRHVRHVRLEDALDAAAAREVALRIDTANTDTSLGGVYFQDDTAERISVINQGARPVLVLGVSLFGPGYHERGQDMEIVNNTSASLELSADKNCRMTLYTADPHQIRVRVRSSRGHEVARILDLPQEVASWVGHAERAKCGYLRPAEALSSEVVSATHHGRDVVVVMHLFNQGVVPLTVTAVTKVPGLRASLKLPVTILPDDADHVNTRTVTVTLRITDCKTYADTAAKAEGWGALRVRLRNRYVTGEGDLRFDSFGPVEQGSGGVVISQDSSGRPAIDTFGMLTATCVGRPVR